MNQHLRANVSLRTGAALDNARHILRSIKRVAVELVGVKRGTLVRSRFTTALKDVADGSERGALVGGDRVFAALEEDILDAGVSASTDIVAVGSDAGNVVVEEVHVEEVVGGGVALVGAVEPVVVDGALGDDIFGPAYKAMSDG